MVNMASGKSKISFYHYNETECVFEENTALPSCANRDFSNHVNWINILGIDDNETLRQTAELFKLHPLVLEDIQNPNQRAKIEDYDESLYLVLRMFALTNGKVQDQQVSMALCNNVLITFREADFGIFKTMIGEKLSNKTGSVRKRGEDFLLYTILDAIIDQYFLVIEFTEERMEKLESEIFRHPHDSQLVTLQRMKHDMLYLRKHIVPVRDLIANLYRNDIKYFEPENKYFLRDLQDHMTRNVEELDFLREQLTSLMDLYYSLQTHKMNNIMKTLTGISFVLLPLTFVASIYGMNFSVIPRSNSPWGFYEVLLGMGLVGVVLVSFAIRRNWLSIKDFRSNKKNL